MLRLTMLALVGLLAAVQGTEATPADEVRAVVERFVAAQNPGGMEGDEHSPNPGTTP